MTLGVWANAKDVPGSVCSDARLTDRSTIEWPWSDRPISASDQLHGQSGWHIGISFLNLRELVDKLWGLARPDFLPGSGDTIGRGEIRRLAIHAHGAAGTIFINGRGDPATLTAESVGTHHSHLHRIGLMTPDDAENHAVIMFAGCVAGMGEGGTKLLKALSRVWPNRKVVAFATLGYAPGGRMKRSGKPCSEPGMRDTNALYAGEADKTASTHWDSLATWPWASERSPHAKVALNERIVHGEQW